MWQLVQAITGLADACQTLGVPVTGGNVSLYNGTGEPGRIDSSINPTPVVGVLGVLDDVTNATIAGWLEPDLSLYLLGVTRDELSGSEWARVIHDHLGGQPPVLDLDAERRLAQILVSASRDHVVAGAHDLSTGGLAQALVDGAMRFGVGARVDLGAVMARDGVDLAAALFSESAGRVLVAVPPEAQVTLADLCSARSYPLLRIGETSEDDSLAVVSPQGEFTIELGELAEVREGTLRRAFA